MALLRYRTWMSIMLFFVRKLASEASLTSRSKANSCRTVPGEPEEPQQRLSMLQRKPSQISAEVSTVSLPEEVEQQNVSSVDASTQSPAGYVMVGMRFLSEQLVSLDHLSSQSQVSAKICILMFAVLAMLCTVWLFTPDAGEELWTVEVMTPHACPTTTAGRLPQRNMWNPSFPSPKPRAPGMTVAKSKPALGSPAFGTPALTPTRSPALTPTRSPSLTPTRSPALTPPRASSLGQLHRPPAQQVDHWTASPRTTTAVPRGIPMVMPPQTISRSSSQSLLSTVRTQRATPPQEAHAVNEAAFYHRRNGPQSALQGAHSAASLQQHSVGYGNPQAVGNGAHEGQRSNRPSGPTVPRLNLPSNPQPTNRLW